MTESQKRPTLADHAASIRNLVSSVEHIAADIDEIKRPKADFETVVAGKCASALDALQKQAESARNSGGNYASLSPSWQMQGGSTYDYQPSYIPPSGPVARVLDYLRQRYGLPDPTIEARRLSAELERAYGRMRELEGRLDQIRGATT